MRRPSLVALAIAMSSVILTSQAFGSTTSEAKPPAIGYSIRGGFELGSRFFTYSDPLVIATNLRPYDVASVPLFTFGGDLRPFVWTNLAVLGDLTFRFDYAFAPSLTSSTNDGNEIQTSWDHGDVTVRIPVRLGKQAYAPRIIPTVGYGWLGFTFVNAGSLAAEIPSVTYRFVRLGLGGDMRLGKYFQLIASFDYLAPLGGGSLYERFRDPIVRGIDANFGFGFNLSPDTRLCLTGNYTRFFSSFEPVPGDSYVAGGALDQFASIKLGIEYGQ